MKTSWPYFAGLVDGEGWLAVTFHMHCEKRYKKVLTPAVMLYIGMKRSDTTEAALRAVQELAWGGTVWVGACRGVPHVRYVSRGRHHLKGVLTNLLPHLIVKKREAELLLSAIDIMNKEMDSIKNDKRGRAVGYSPEVMIKIAEIGDQVSSFHARQVPKKWTADNVGKALRGEHVAYALCMELEIPETGENGV